MLCGFPRLLGLLETRAHGQILVTDHIVSRTLQTTQAKRCAASQNVSQAQSAISDSELSRRAPCKGRTKQYMEMDAAHLNQMLTSAAV